MTETLVNEMMAFLQNKIPEELVAFVISLFPVLECRGGMIAARLMEMGRVKVGKCPYLIEQMQNVGIVKNKVSKNAEVSLFMQFMQAIWKQARVEKRKIVLADPIKAFGSYTLDVKLYPEISGKLTVSVVEK